ncbi:hypothetical protein D9M72_413500 [compost metagenome]
MGIEHRLPGRVDLRLAVFDRRDQADCLVGIEVLDHALADQRQRNHGCDRRQHVQRDPGHVDPEVADGGGALARKAAHQREHHGDAGCRGQEVLHGERQHLRQIAHGRLAGIALPVGIADKADGGVEGRVRRDRAEALRVQRQHALHALQRVDRQHAKQVERQDGDGVLLPPHLRFGAHAAQAVQQPLQRSAPGGQRITAVLHRTPEIAAEKRGARQQDGEIQDQQAHELGGHQNFSGRNNAMRR